MGDDMRGARDAPGGEIPRERGLVQADEGRYLPSTEFRESVPSMEEEVSLRDYLDVLLRRKWLILSFLVLTFVSTMVFTLASTKIYKATATVEVTPASPKVTKFEEVVESQIRSQEFLQTQVGLLQSEALALRVIKKMDLERRLDEVKARLGQKDEERKGIVTVIKDFIKSALTWFQPKGEGEEQATEQRMLFSEEVLKEKRLLGFVKGNLTITPRRNSMLVDIEITSPDRRLSQDLANTLASEYVLWEMDKKLDASSLAKDFLMKQIDRAKIELERSEEELNRFARESGIVSLDSKLNSVYRQLEEINGALAKAQSDLLAKEAVYEQATKDGPGSLPQVLSSAMIGALKEEYAKVRSEYEKQAVIFMDEYPAVKSLKQRMESILRQVKEEEQKIFAAIRHEYEAAKKGTASLERALTEQKRQALQLNEQATQYKIMERQVDTNKAIYQSLLQRAKEIESMVGVSASNLHVVDPATLPILPFKPKVMMNLLLGIVVGLMGGIGLAFLLEYFADTITKPEEISERFQIPILGVAPLIKGEAYPVEKAFVSDPRSSLSEALRTTKVSIQLSRADANAKSLMITSTVQGEGKSTLACNMAMAFAQAGERVVMIDADLRRPRLHKVFGEASANGKGLSSLLAGVVNENPICETEVDNLFIIPAGPIPPNPVELLASSRFGKLMEYLEGRYDRVIVDAPPNQGFADVLVLSKQVGGVILILTLGSTTREGVRHFKRSILNVNGKILGAIINRVDFGKRYGYRYYYRYYRHYYYYEDGTGDKKRRRGRRKSKDKERRGQMGPSDLFDQEGDGR